MSRIRILFLSFVFVLAAGTSAWGQLFDVNNQQLSFNNPPATLPTSLSTSPPQAILYTNVITLSGTQIDAIIRTESVSGVTTLLSYDQPDASGSNFTGNSALWFSPQFSFSGTGGAVTYKIEFILGGTYNSTTQKGTTVTLQNLILNTYDIDGNGTTGSNQYNEFGGFSKYELANPTNIGVTYNSTTELTRFRSNLSSNTTDATDVKNRVRISIGNASEVRVTVGGLSTAFFFIDFNITYKALP